MDGNHLTSVLKHYDVKNMHEKEPALPLNGEMVLSSAHITNGYSSKLADNDGSGSESGYTTPKKRRARRSSAKGTENTSREKEKAPKPYSKQDSETLGAEMSGKALHSQLDCTRTCVKAEAHTGVRRADVPDSSPVAEVQSRNSDSKTSGGLVAKKTDDRVSKTKPVSAVSSKEDSWTLFKPPPVFPVDNSSAKIVPKISYASKVKENLNKASQASAEVSGRLSDVPMSAVRMVLSASFTNDPASLDANGCYSAETSFSSAASSNQAEEDALSDGCSSPSRLSAPEPRKSSLFVYPHKPLNMQPPAAQTNQKALGAIFQNQWGLSFINEPNAGPQGAPVSRPTVAFEISDITFQGGNVPFPIQPSLNAVSLPEPQDAPRKNSGSNAVARRCPAPHTASQDHPRTESGHPKERRAERKCSYDSYEDSAADSTRNSVLNCVKGLSKTHTVKEPDEADGWGRAVLQAAILYHTKKFEYLLTLHKQDPKRVMYYKEVVDRPDY